MLRLWTNFFQNPENLTLVVGKFTHHHGRNFFPYLKLIRTTDTEEQSSLGGTRNLEEKRTTETVILIGKESKLRVLN
jgi:hypothetical protein